MVFKIFIVFIVLFQYVVNYNLVFAEGVEPTTSSGSSPELGLVFSFVFMIGGLTYYFLKDSIDDLYFSDSGSEVNLSNVPIEFPGNRESDTITGNVPLIEDAFSINDTPLIVSYPIPQIGSFPKIPYREAYFNINPPIYINFIKMQPYNNNTQFRDIQADLLREYIPVDRLFQLPSGSLYIFRDIGCLYDVIQKLGKDGPIHPLMVHLIDYKPKSKSIASSMDSLDSVGLVINRSNTLSFSEIAPEIDLTVELGSYNKLLDYYVLTLTKRKFERMSMISDNVGNNLILQELETEYRDIINRHYPEVLNRLELDYGNVLNYRDDVDLFTGVIDFLDNVKERVDDYLNSEMDVVFVEENGYDLVERKGRMKLVDLVGERMSVGTKFEKRLDNLILEIQEKANHVEFWRKRLESIVSNADHTESSFLELVSFQTELNFAKDLYNEKESEYNMLKDLEKKLNEVIENYIDDRIWIQMKSLELALELKEWGYEKIPFPGIYLEKSNFYLYGDSISNYCSYGESLANYISSSSVV